MSDPSDTVVLPRVRIPTGNGESARRDRWQNASLGGGERDTALATLAWTLPTVLAVVLSMIRISWPDLSSSELSVWGTAGLPATALRRLLGELDPLAAPYHVLIWAWSKVAGTSDLALRVPSVLFTAATVALTAALGSRLLHPRVGVTVGFLLALVPSTSRFAQQAGPQALMVAAAALSTFLLIRVLDDPTTGRLSGYFASVLLLGLSSPIALVVLLAHGCVVAFMRPRVLLGWAVAALVGAAPGGAVLVLGRHIAAPRDIADRLPTDQLVSVGFGTLLVGGMVLGLAVLAVSVKKPAVVLTAWAVLPLVGLYIVAGLLAVDPPRAALVTVPAWTFLAAMSLSRGPVVRGLAVATVIGLLGLSTQAGFRSPDGHGLAGRALARTLSANVQPGDVVVYGRINTDGLVGRDVMARYVPADKRPKDVLLVRAPRVDGHLLADECPDLARCMTGVSRIWLVRATATRTPLDNLPSAKAELLRPSYNVERTWLYTGLTLTLLIPAPVKR